MRQWWCERRRGQHKLGSWGRKTRCKHASASGDADRPVCGGAQHPRRPLALDSVEQAGRPLQDDPGDPISAAPGPNEMQETTLCQCEVLPVRDWPSTFRLRELYGTPGLTLRSHYLCSRAGF